MTDLVLSLAATLQTLQTLQTPCRGQCRHRHTRTASAQTTDGGLLCSSRHKKIASSRHMRTASYPLRRYAGCSEVAPVQAGGKHMRGLLDVLWLA